MPRSLREIWDSCTQTHVIKGGIVTCFGKANGPGLAFFLPDRLAVMLPGVWQRAVPVENNPSGEREGTTKIVQIFGLDYPIFIRE